MHTKNTTVHLHSRIALEIKAAKKTMFRRHREGQSLVNTVNSFIVDVQRRLHSALAANDAQVKPRSVRIPIVGTVGDEGINLFADTEREEHRASAEARLVAGFLEGGPPDFLLEAVLDALAAAYKHVGLPYDASQEDKAETLYPLFLKTKLISLDEMTGAPEPPAETARQRLAVAIQEILTNEDTPEALQDRVEDFVCGASDGPLAQFWNVPGSVAAMEHLLNFVEWKDANEAS